MTQVYVVRGGESGALLRGDQGVRPIPPFNRGLREEMSALSALLRVASQNPNQRERKASLDIVRKLSTQIVGQVEAVVGPIDDEAGLVYQDDDGGFTCGSTGKPPIPFPWPASRLGSVEDLVIIGSLERELGELFERAPELDATYLLEHPAEAAGKAGVRLSERTIEQLQGIAPSTVEQIPDPAVREVLTFFHRVLDDRRFIDTWSRRPYEVSKKLNIELSARASDLILAGGNAVAIPGAGPVSIVWIVVVIVVAVIVVADNEARIVREFVVDRSGVDKL